MSYIERARGCWFRRQQGWGSYQREIEKLISGVAKEGLKKRKWKYFLISLNIETDEGNLKYI